MLPPQNIPDVFGPCGCIYLTVVLSPIQHQGFSLVEIPAYGAALFLVSAELSFFKFPFVAQDDEDNGAARSARSARADLAAYLR